MWNDNFSGHVFLESKTENGYVVITLLFDQKFSVNRYDTLVFRYKLDGSINIDNCLDSELSPSEDQAYINHMNLWKKYNRGKND